MEQRGMGAAGQFERSERFQHDRAVDDGVRQPAQPDVKIGGRAVGKRQQAQAADPRSEHGAAGGQDGPDQHEAEDKGERNPGSRGVGRQLRQHGIGRRGQGGDGQQVQHGADREAADADGERLALPVFHPPARRAEQEPHQPFRKQAEQQRQSGFPHAADQRRSLRFARETAAQPLPGSRQVGDDTGEILEAAGQRTRPLGQTFDQHRLGPRRGALRRLRRLLRCNQRLELRQEAFALLLVLDGGDQFFERRPVDLLRACRRRFLRCRRNRRRPLRQQYCGAGSAQKEQQAKAKAVEHGPEQAYLSKGSGTIRRRQHSNRSGAGKPPAMRRPAGRPVKPGGEAIPDVGDNLA